MALIQCPECGNEISDKASACPNCGYPVVGTAHTEGTEKTDEKKEQPNIQNPTSIQGEAEESNLKSSDFSTQKIAVAMIIIVAIISVIVIFSVMKQRNKVDFNSLQSVKTSDYCEISDDGTYMTIDTNPFDLEDYFSSEAYENIKTVNEELGLPESVTKKMDETRALDGRLEEEYNGIKVSWTYHPDDGLEVMYEVIDE